jgi:hypothetical protein
VAAAEHQFKLSRRGADGVCLREKLLHIEQTTGRRPAALDGPEIPAEVAHVWGWFCELDSQRSGNGFGGNPISWGEIAAWAALTGSMPRPHEVRMLLRLDRARLEVMNLKEEADG